MPKNPIDSAAEAVQKIQQVHNKAEQLRQTLEHVDPLQMATDTINNIMEKVNQLDAIAAKTRRRTRRSLPKQD